MLRLGSSGGSGNRETPASLLGAIRAEKWQTQRPVAAWELAAFGRRARRGTDGRKKTQKTTFPSPKRSRLNLRFPCFLGTDHLTAKLLTEHAIKPCPDSPVLRGGGPAASHEREPTESRAAGDARCGPQHSTRPCARCLTQGDVRSTPGQHQPSHCANRAAEALNRV